MNVVNKPKKSLIKALRFHANLRQSELAEMLNVSQPTISYWENLEWKPSLVYMEKLVKIAVRHGFKLTVRRLQNEWGK